MPVSSQTINEQIGAIKALQIQENAAIQTVQTNPTAGNVQALQNITQLRETLYNTLTNSINSVGSISPENSYDTNAILATNNALDIASSPYTAFRPEHNLNLRKIEINAYYSEQFAEKTNIIKTIILTCIPILLLTIIKNKGFLPENIYTVLVIIISCIGIYYVGFSVIRLFSRDNMIYSEYDWFFNKANAPAIDTSGAELNDSANKIPSTKCQP